jgi:hypothetical protein
MTDNTEPITPGTQARHTLDKHTLDMDHCTECLIAYIYHWLQIRYDLGTDFPMTMCFPILRRTSATTAV